MSTGGRAQRKQAEHENKAVDVQLQGAVKGAIRWTLIGATACVVGHYTWPFFRRQTLALKGFITSSATIFGLVMGADNQLISYERDLRHTQGAIRRQAKLDLIREGKLPTETEIHKWRQEHGVTDVPNRK